MSRYCPNCERYVDGKKTFHGVAFLLIIIFIWGPGFLLGGFLGLLSGYVTGDLTVFGLWLIWMSLPFIYILYHVFGKKPRCPICNTLVNRKDSSNKIGQKQKVSRGISTYQNSQMPKVSREAPSAQISPKPKETIGQYSNNSVFFAQIIFGGLGALFTLIGVLSILTFRPSFIFIIIGLPLIAVASLLNVLHKKRNVPKTGSVFPQILEGNEQVAKEPRHRIDLHIHKMFCRYCGAEVPVDSVYCEKCGKKLQLTVESEPIEVVTTLEIDEIPAEPIITESEKEIIPLKQELKPFVEKYPIIESEEIEIFREQAEIVITKNIRLGLEPATLTKYEGEITLTDKRVIMGTMESGQMLLPIEGIINIQVMGAFEKSLGIHMLSTMEGHRLNIEFELKSQNIDSWLQAFKKLPNVNIKRKWI